MARGCSVRFGLRWVHTAVRQALAYFATVQYEPIASNKEYTRSRLIHPFVTFRFLMVSMNA